MTFTANNFRRILVTDATMNGMSPHIAQLILGGLSRRIGTRPLRTPTSSLPE
ncbi:hypothetical protein [Catenulispora yoronensis]|uniref:hypothetical protein n=1 Tax=Catenulispora yoronensis TaxID=450799 RepID=UPI0031DE6DCB